MQRKNKGQLEHQKR